MVETGLGGLFFTGTDTGVGKTVVTAGVARLLRRQGRVMAVCKPVATGASRRGNRWVSDDTLQLAQAAETAEDWEQVTFWSFPDPVAPPIAAWRQGVSLSLAAVARAVRGRFQPGRPLLVEGVGGLLCPLTEDGTVADLAGELDLPVVIVTRRSLGTLNHTLLTLEVARRRDLRVAGVVVNTVTPLQGLAEESALEEMQRLGVPVLAALPHQPQGVSGIAPGLEEVDWWRLCFSHSSRGEEERGLSCRP